MWWKTLTAQKYAISQLLLRAGVSSISEFPVSVHYGDNSNVLHPYSIVIHPCSDDAWQNLLEMPEHTLGFLPADETIPHQASLPFEDVVPILFWGENQGDKQLPFAEVKSDNYVVFYVDLVATTLFMLSRWEETIVPVRDAHQRFPATASVAYKQGFLDRPLVDEYALILREWLKILLPDWKPETRTFSIKLSHDIDQLFHFRDGKSALRTLAGDMLKRRQPVCAMQTVRKAIEQKFIPNKTPYFRGLRWLAELSQRYNFGDDAFYFMTANVGLHEQEYTLSSPIIAQAIKDLRLAGFEIGLHSGYHTLNDPQRLAEEKARLDTILGTTKYGGRQHYLRFHTPDTWRHWEQVGFTYDATVGYADCEGFRCGTCYPFQPFDFQQDRVLDIWEYPLIVMDATLANYRRMTPQQGKNRILELAIRCKSVGGVFTLLWHNSSLFGEWELWRKAYEDILHALTLL